MVGLDGTVPILNAMSEQRIPTIDITAGKPAVTSGEKFVTPQGHKAIKNGIKQSAKSGTKAER